MVETAGTESRLTPEIDARPIAHETEPRWYRCSTWIISPPNQTLPGIPFTPHMNRTDRAIQIAAAIGVLLVVLPVALPHDTRASAVLQDFMHGPVFALVAVVAWRVLRTRTSTRNRSTGQLYALALAISALLGGVTELLQIPGARDASVHDWLADLVGAVTGLAAQAYFAGSRTGRHRRRLLAAVTALAGCAVLLAPAVQATLAYGNRWLRFPEVAGARSMPLGHLDTYFLSGMAARVSIKPLPDPWHRESRETSLEVVLGPVTWPGLALEEPYPDWRGYQTLLVDLTNPQDQPLEFTLRIHDRHHNNQLDDRFNGVLTVAPHSRQVVRIPLSDVQRAPTGRSMDMERIAGLILFRTSPGQEGQTVYVTRMVLEK